MSKYENRINPLFQSADHNNEMLVNPELIVLKNHKEYKAKPDSKFGYEIVKIEGENEEELNRPIALTGGKVRLLPEKPLLFWVGIPRTGELYQKVLLYKKDLEDINEFWRDVLYRVLLEE